MTLKITCSNPVRKGRFCGFFYESEGNSKGINLPKSFFVNFVRAGVRSSLHYIILLNPNVVTFGFKYILLLMII